MNKISPSPIELSKEPAAIRHGSCEYQINPIPAMNSKLVSNIEFFGGPEDGLVLSGEETQRFLEAAGPHAHQEIPMFVRDQTPGRLQGRMVLIGFYIAGAHRGSTMCYQWVA